MPSAVVLTISDSRSRGENADRSGPAAVDKLTAAGLRVAAAEIIPDDQARIVDRLRAHVNRVELIVSTGGTGIAPRDVTPEAAAEVIERPLPGFGEIMRHGTYARTPLSIISRGGAGVAGRTLIVYLPGSPKAVAECLDLLLPAIRHVVELLAGRQTDCATTVATNHPLTDDPAPR